jgi:CoA:oxalate CoA-transferase
MTAAIPAETPHPHQALRKIRVLDFSAMIAGPYCARWLGDMGAEVVKIEASEGDHMRTRAPLRDGHSSFFAHLNAGKRFLSIDLKNPAGVILAKQLIREADILIEAFRPGVMARLGLGPDVSLDINPRLVYCSISGFGQTGPEAQRPAYAPVVHAASGYYMALSGTDDPCVRPPDSSVPLADMLTSIFAGFSIQTALLHREHTGMGSVIDVNLIDSILNVMPYEFQAAQFPLRNFRPKYRPLKTKDSYIIVAPINARNFRSVCHALGHPEWQDDPLLRTNEARYANWGEYMRRIELWTAERSSEECEAVLSGSGVPCSRYRRISEVIRDPRFPARRAFSTVSDSAGQLLATNLPFFLDNQRPQAGGHVGAVGEDSDAVLSDWLGISGAEFHEFLAAHVVFKG